MVGHAYDSGGGLTACEAAHAEYSPPVAVGMCRVNMSWFNSSGGMDETAISVIYGHMGDAGSGCIGKKQQVGRHP